MSRKRGLPSLDDHVRQQGSCPTDAKPSTDDVTVERDQSIPKYGHRDSQTDFRNRRFAST
jgi:hypothetical protein